ncbi:unnamed protein product [Protopolystoma xenopodis]|uniref:Uncharacterized protein n=1 Tax=Protopolystoma xenopodis TaxID=117903 RepID=A0A3S5BPV4_9PLAT|nr:unnamed protein product [Protopolystoma xenopodis]
MSFSRSNISSKALTDFLPKMLVYMDCTSKHTNSFVPTAQSFGSFEEIIGILYGIRKSVIYFLELQANEVLYFVCCSMLVVDY